MKSEAEIRYNFNQAIKRAEELEGVATEMRNLANRELSDSMQQLSGAWQGEAASLYLQKGQQLKEKIVGTARNLVNTANTIRSVATRTYNAEMRALEIARERAYNMLHGGGSGGGGR